MGWILRQVGRTGGRRYAEICGVPGFPGPSEEEMERGVSNWLDGGDPGTRGPADFARWSFERAEESEVSIPSAGLVGGEGEATDLEGFSAVKMKIGVGPADEEQERVRRILDGTPEDCRIRLDANGALGMEDLRAWVQWMEGTSRIDFIEQPLPEGREEDLMRAFGSVAGRMALDESLSCPEDLERLLDAGWPGRFVVKPMLFGSTGALENLPLPVRRRLILSSVFETGIGFGKLLLLARVLGVGETVHGLGTRGFFEDAELDGWGPAPRYEGRLTEDFFAGIWDRASAAAT